MEELSIIEQFRTHLRRAAWRGQYRTRLERKYIVPLDSFDTHGSNGSISNEIISKLFIIHLLSQIPQPRGRKIIVQLILENRSEQEVANDLNISQQAVNKWKKRALNVMREHLMNGFYHY